MCWFEIDSLAPSTAAKEVSPTDGADRIANAFTGW